MNNRQRWERVLNAVEAEARRAEALLEAVTNADATADSADAAEMEGAEGALAVPSDWLLPAAEVLHSAEAVDPIAAFNAHHEPELPPLDEMPPVPEELGQRILDLRAQIIRLQEELEQAMRDWQPVLPPAVPSPRARQPIYVDRQL